MVNDKEFNIDVDGNNKTLIGFTKWYSRNTHNPKSLLLLTKAKDEMDNLTILYHIIDEECGESIELLNDIRTAMERVKGKTIILLNIKDVIRNKGKAIVIKDGFITYKLETKEVK